MDQTLLEYLLATGSTFVFRRSGEGVITYVSPNVAQILGYSPEEIVGDGGFWAEHLHADDSDRIASGQPPTSGETEVEQDYRFLGKDGRYRWLRVRTRLDLEEPGTGLILGYATDITDRKLSEEALLEAERRTRLILDTAYEAFVSIDLDGLVLDWNAQAERIFGWSRKEAVGRVLAETIVPERHRAAHIGGLEHYRATGEGPLLGQRVEIEALRRDGSEFPVELTISPMPVDGTVVFNAFLRDITSRRQAEAALQAASAAAERAREEAVVANQAKSDFLARMSHELRTPLNAILGFAQLLEMEDLGAQDENVKHIIRAGKHLLQLIDEVLEVARIEQGQLSLSIEPVPLADVVGDAVDLVRPLGASAQVRIEVEVAPSEMYVLADGQRLKQVVMNLLSNAIKYNREGGRVTVSYPPAPAGRVRIAVADTGQGIAAEMMDRLFLPFERLGAEQTQVEGTGIGLSISKRIVEVLGGELGVESRVGKGSIFWVELEAANAPTQPEDQVKQLPDAPAAWGGDRIVLYVEDNLANLRLVERIISWRPAVRLIAAMQGGLAVELARQHRPHLILLDVHLPDIDGDEVLRRLREQPETRTTPVVMVSAEATPQKVERFLSGGAHAYLTKPLDVKHFLEVVDEILTEEP